LERYRASIETTDPMSTTLDESPSKEPEELPRVEESEELEEPMSDMHKELLPQEQEAFDMNKSQLEPQPQPSTPETFLEVSPQQEATVACRDSPEETQEMVEPSNEGEEAAVSVPASPRLGQSLRRKRKAMEVDDSVASPSSVIILAPIRTSRKEKALLGSDLKLTPIRRSRRLSTISSQVNVKDLLAQTGFTFAPNKYILESPSFVSPGLCTTLASTTPSSVSSASFPELETITGGNSAVIAESTKPKQKVV
jgi:hypothetical protein